MEHFLRWREIIYSSDSVYTGRKNVSRVWKPGKYELGKRYLRAKEKPLYQFNNNNYMYGHFKLLQSQAEYSMPWISVSHIRNPAELDLLWYHVFVTLYCL